jgi:hypothetical protein
MHPNYNDTRRMLESHTLAALTQHHTPEEMKAVEPLIKEYIANTITDEFLFQDFNRMAAEKRAKEALDAAEWARVDAARKAAAKIKRDHQDHLDREKAATAVALEEAEVWEKRSRTLKGQLSALTKRQGR